MIQPSTFFPMDPRVFYNTPRITVKTIFWILRLGFFSLWLEEIASTVVTGVSIILVLTLSIIVLASWGVEGKGVSL